MKNRTLQVAEVIFSDFQKAVGESGVPLKAQSLKLQRNSWAEGLLSCLEKGECFAAVIPCDWQPSETPDFEKLKLAVVSGKLRICSWGARAKDYPVHVLPVFGLAKDRGKKVLAAMLRHLDGASTSGVQSILSQGAMIFSERVSSDREIGRKLDAACQFLEQQGVKRESGAMNWRLAASAVLAAVFGGERKPGGAGPVRLQFGANDGLVAIAVKWGSASVNARALFDPEFPLKVAIQCADAFWLHFMPEAKETECVVLISEHPRPQDWAPSSLGVDFLTNARLQLFEDQLAANAGGSHEYRSFSDLPQPDPVSSEAEQDARKNSDEGMESRPNEEVERLRNEQVVLQKKLNTALESQAMDKKELEDLRAKVRAKSRETADSEVNLNDSLRQKLEVAKMKEQELSRKLADALDKVKQLQGRKK